MARSAALQKVSAALAQQADRWPLDVIRSLDRLEDTLGGRQMLLSLLALAPMTRDLRVLLGLLGDPENERTPLAELCALGGVLPGVLLDHLQRGTMARAHTLAIKLVAEGTPAVVADTMRRAAPHEEGCDICAQTGWVTPDPTPEVPDPKEARCPQCRGIGKILIEPDPACRKLALDLAKLLPSGPGVSIVNQQAISVQSAGAGAFAPLQEAVDQILYGPGSRATTPPEGVDDHYAPPLTPDAPPILSGQGAEPEDPDLIDVLDEEAPDDPEASCG